MRIWNKDEKKDTLHNMRSKKFNDKKKDDEEKD